MPDGRFLTAYIDLPFLERLFREKPEDPATPPHDNWPEVWQNVYRFLQKSAKIVVGADRDTINSNGLLARFLFGMGNTRHVEPRSGLISEYKSPEEVDIDNPFSVYLFESPEVPIGELRERTGLLFLRYKNLKTDWPRLFREHVVNVLPKEEPPFEWSDLCPHAVPLNAVVIADKYAHEQFNDKSFDQNLGALLRTILPEDQLDVPIHVTLVTDLTEPYDEGVAGPNEICDRLRDKLQDYRPDLTFRVTVVGYGRNGHKDRYIFTNYGVFSSNDSFTFFKNGALDKETLVTYHPNSTRGSTVTRPRLQRLQDLCNDPREYGTEGVLLASGANKNRLLRVVD